MRDSTGAPPPTFGRQVQIPAGTLSLHGELTLPEDALGVVLFAQGTGSSRTSERSQQIAEQFRRGNLGTLLFDLLTPDEDRVDALTEYYRYDVELLARRLIATADWVSRDRTTEALRIGILASGTAAAAALIAAAERPELVAAIVSRGGRPDLAGHALGRVRAPTLLVVGAADEVIIDPNREALAALRCAKRLALVPRATRLFEEPGATEEVGRLAGRWFSRYLAAAERATARRLSWTAALEPIAYQGPAGI